MKSFIPRIIGVVLLALVAWAIYQITPKITWTGIHSTPPSESSASAERVTDFDSCVAAGNPVMESYPRQCNSNGVTYVENAPQTSESIYANACAVAGCSQQLCVSAREAQDIVTTCEWRPEYACYGEASCEVQANGQCGWTDTPELRRCIANPPGESASPYETL